MSKCWSELISQRIQLKVLGGGAGDLPSRFGAKMQMPEGHTVYTFAITDIGIGPSSWWEGLHSWYALQSSACECVNENSRHLLPFHDERSSIKVTSDSDQFCTGYLSIVEVFAMSSNLTSLLRSAAPDLKTSMDQGGSGWKSYSICLSRYWVYLLVWVILTSRALPTSFIRPLMLSLELQVTWVSGVNLIGLLG